MSPESRKILLGQVERVVEEVIRGVGDHHRDSPAGLAGGGDGHCQPATLLLSASTFLHVHLCSIQRSL